MAELTISSADIESAIGDYVASFARSPVAKRSAPWSTPVTASPTSRTLGDDPGVARVRGGVLGVALNLDEHEIGAVILGDSEKIEEGASGSTNRRGPLRAGGRRLPGPGDQPAR